MGWVEAPPEPDYVEDEFAEYEEEAEGGEEAEAEPSEDAVDLAAAEGEARDA
jgi:N utilization substance protein A